MSDYDYELRRAGEVIATGRIQLDEEPSSGETMSLGSQDVVVDEVLFVGGRRRLILEQQAA